MYHLRVQPNFKQRTATTCKVAHVDPVRKPGSVAQRQRHEEISTSTKVPPTVNWHLTPFCNYSCRFCFATFDDTDKSHALKDQERMEKVLVELKSLGFTRITFVGGEPLLHPHIDRLIMHAKELGLNTCLVTNGSLLTPGRLKKLGGSLDILAFSIDASSDALHAEMGRGLKSEIWNSQQIAAGTPGTEVPNRHILRILDLLPLIRQLGVTVKVNTVVSSVNVNDDMTQLIKTIKPHRWKIFQALPVEGQNTGGSIEPLLITPQAFTRYVCHAQAGLLGSGIAVVPEDNDAMRGTYAMLDHEARFFTNNVPPEAGRGTSTGCGHGYMYGHSILQVGGPAAWRHVSQYFDGQGFLQRGGVWDYGQEKEVLAKDTLMAQQVAAAAATQHEH